MFQKTSSLPFIFLHIPKTAGTTFSTILGQRYQGQLFAIDGRDPQNDIDRYLALSVDARKTYTVVKGHQSFGMHQHVPHPCSYIAFLREPVARVVSFYNYLKHRSDHFVYKMINEEGLTLEAFARSGLPFVNNNMTRLISGDVPTSLSIPIRPNTHDFSECDPLMLERAKQNLDTHFKVVGFTERFDESLLLLTKNFDWTPPYYVRVNVGKGGKKETVSQEALDIIRVRNQLDIELYDYAMQKFDAQIEDIDAFDGKLRRFQNRNKSYAQYRGMRASLGQFKRRLMGES